MFIRQFIKQSASCYSKRLGSLSQVHKRRLVYAAVGVVTTTTGTGYLATSVPPFSSEKCCYDGNGNEKVNSTLPLNHLSPPQYCSTIADFEDAIEKISVKLPDADSQVSFATDDRYNHSLNAAAPHKIPAKDKIPGCVIYPTSTEDVVAVVKIANEYKIPIVPFGSGSSLEGHIYTTRPFSIALDMRRMDKIISVNEDDLDIQVQAGVPYSEINKILSPKGLILGSDCAPNAVIGGMVATNASGINAFAFGPMKDNVVNLTVVLADGTVIKTRQRPRKTSAGYNLNNLFVGSEGTLGIVVEATVKVHVKPRYDTTVIAQFNNLGNLTDTVSELIRKGVPLYAIELMDANMMKCLNYSGASRTWLNTPSLLLTIGGLNKIIVDEYLKEVDTIAHKHSCQSIVYPRDKEEEHELFQLRKNSHYYIVDYGYNEVSENCRMWGTDVAVPMSKLTHVLETSHNQMRDNGIEFATVGHVGDSNFHFNLLYKPEEEDKVAKLVGDLVILGLQNEGTCTGEHGVGTGKRKYLQMELGNDTIDLMRQIKLSLDPNRIMNPDKIFSIDPSDIV